MDVVLAVMTESPYRDSVAQFAAEYAASIKGRARVLAPGLSPETRNDAVALLGAEAQDSLLGHALDDAEAEVDHFVAEEAERLAEDAPALTEGHRALGPPVAECIREMARCDFGVVGKTLKGALPAGQGLGRQVAQLERSCTKPLIIVPVNIQPIRRVLFVYTDHPEAGHALALARPLSESGAEIVLFSAITPLGRDELRGTGSAYLQEHSVSHETVDSDCSDCEADGGGAGPVGQVLHLVDQEGIDLVVMGGTRRGFFGRMMWPEMAHEVAWNIQVPLLIWY